MIILKESIIALTINNDNTSELSNYGADKILSVKTASNNSKIVGWLLDKIDKISKGLSVQYVHTLIKAV